MHWTSQGIGGLPAWRDRVEESDAVIKERGGKLIDVYVTLGRYDVVEIFEAPNDETASSSSWPARNRAHGDSPRLHARRGGAIVRS